MSFPPQTEARNPAVVRRCAIEVSAVSHCGLTRTHNEDAWFADATLGFAIVADGVGGHSDGALASRTAVECIGEYVRRANALVLREGGKAAPGASCRNAKLQERAAARAIDFANGRLANANAVIGNVSDRRGTTIAGLWAPFGTDSTATLFHVGDSRIYVMRNGQLRALTRDHSAYQQWLDADRQGAP